jgi:hypothetical protein
MIMAQSLSNVIVHVVFSHHRRVSFQDEYRQILAKYEIEYDERYVWD